LEPFGPCTRNLWLNSATPTFRWDPLTPSIHSFRSLSNGPARITSIFCVLGDEQERRHLAFRDYLRSHPAVCRRLRRTQTRSGLLSTMVQPSNHARKLFALKVPVRRFRFGARHFRQANTMPTFISGSLFDRPTARSLTSIARKSRGVRNKLSVLISVTFETVLPRYLPAHQSNSLAGSGEGKRSKPAIVKTSPLRTPARSHRGRHLPRFKLSDTYVEWPRRPLGTDRRRRRSPASVCTANIAIAILTNGLPSRSNAARSRPLRLSAITSRDIIISEEIGFVKTCQGILRHRPVANREIRPSARCS